MTGSSDGVGTVRYTLGIEWPTGYGSCVHGDCDADATTVDSHGDPLCATHDRYRHGPDADGDGPDD